MKKNDYFSEIEYYYIVKGTVIDEGDETPFLFLPDFAPSARSFSKLSKQEMLASIANEHTENSMRKSSPIKMTLILPFMTLQGREHCSRALIAMILKEKECIERIGGIRQGKEKEKGNIVGRE